MKLQLSLAARYLGRRKLRTTLTTLAIIFGVLLIFGMNTVLPTMIAALQANVQGVEGQIDFSITNISGESFPQEIANRLQNVAGLRAVSASLNRTINLPADYIDRDPARPDTLIAVNLVGVTSEDARSVRAYAIIEGRYLEDSDTASAVISQTLADALSVKVGESFSLPGASGLTELTVVGILPPNIMPITEEILVNLPQAQEMTGETDRVNLIDINIEGFADEARRNEIQQQIETALGKNYQVGTLTAGDEMFAAMELGQIGLSVFGALALFMGGFIIFNTFRTIVTERRRDIGMLRALGATRRTVIGIILAESLLQGLIGSAIGLILGYLMALGIIKIVQGPLSLFINLKLGAPVISPLLVLFSVGLGVGVTVLAGLLPAWNASRITPLEALRPSQAEIDVKRKTGIGFIVGMLILIVTTFVVLSGQSALIIPGGLFFLAGLVLVTPALVNPLANLFGPIISWITVRQGIGGLAKSNLKRQPARVAVTASASMLGLAVIVAAGGLVSSMTGIIDELMLASFGSDYLFVPPSVMLWGSNIGSSPEFAQDLREVEGVEEVSTFRYGATTTNGQAVSLIGIDPEAFPNVSGLHFLKGNQSAYKKLASKRTLVVNGAFLLAIDAKAGDTIELQTTNGTVSYEIVAVGMDLLNAKVTTAYLSQANLETDFGVTEDVFIQLNLAEDASREAVKTEIWSLAANYPQYKLISGTDYYGAMKTQMDAAFSAVYIVFVFLAIPSLIAMMNTLTISVLERTREIGMVRAVGGTRRQVRNMVLAEALLLAAIGTFFGILGGMYLGYVFVTGIKVLFPLGYYFPVSGITTAVIIGLFFGLLAAIIPARQAARLEIVQALRYE
ncbi:MAG: FtsX-like permease family protein [Anaerolineales bacterium]|nr:FtsX-like permease family protein [Anaerolineales bacterium]